MNACAHLSMIARFFTFLQAPARDGVATISEDVDALSLLCEIVWPTCTFVFL